MAVKAGAVVRPSTDADRPEIAALLDRLLREAPLERRVRLWEWRAADNPAADGTMPEFLVVEKEGRLVGIHGLFPLRMKVGDRMVVAATACDFAIDPGARNLGLQLKLEAMSSDLADLALSTSSNETAQRITTALGGLQVPWARTKFVKPLRLSGLLRNRLRSRLGDGTKAAAAGAAARVVGVPADAALRWGRAARRRVSASGVAVETVERFDGDGFRRRFDDLWSRLAPAWPVAVVRDARYLRWRYGRYPFPGIEAIAARKAEEATGFAAVHHYTDSIGLPFASLLDLFGEDEEVLAALLAEAIRRADARGAHYMTAEAGPGPLRDLLEERGFRARDRGFSPYNVRANDPDLESLVTDPAMWYLAQGDGDICFYMGK